MKYFIINLLFLGCLSTNQIDDKKKFVDVMAENVSKQFKDISHIDASEIVNNQESYIFVDVRSEKEMAVSKIPGAITEKELNNINTDSKKIIIYCTIGQRSSVFVKNFKSRYKDIYNLKGGVLSWAFAGGQFEHNGKVTNKVHVYGEAWNVLPKTHVGVLQ